VTEGCLIVVPTPIGNLGDMTHRAVQVLKDVDLVACEDTRTSGVLFAHYGITTARTSFHLHNEHGKALRLAEQMAGGTRMALVSDAGTPGISDPGYLLVRAALDLGIRVEVLPGATALIPALVASGLPSERFVYDGFLPVKKGRRTRLTLLASEVRTTILYESPRRLPRTLRDLVEACGSDRPACVGREISKRFEEYIRGTLGEIAKEIGSRSKIKGEIVIVLGGAAK
jgi:16S rRNA (cytidine1402-2'-O)-methyltransferase